MSVSDAPAIQALVRFAKQHRRADPEVAVRIDCVDDRQRGDVLTAMSRRKDAPDAIFRVIRVPANRELSFTERSLAALLLRFMNPSRTKWLDRRLGYDDHVGLMEHIKLHGWTPDLEPQFERAATEWRTKHSGVDLTLVVPNPGPARSKSLQAAGAILDIFRRATRCGLVILCVANEMHSLDLFGSATIGCPSGQIGSVAVATVESLLGQPIPTWPNSLTFVQGAARNLDLGSRNAPWRDNSVHQTFEAWRALFNAFGATAVDVARSTIDTTAIAFKPSTEAEVDGPQFYDDLCWFALITAFEHGGLLKTAGEALADTIFSWQIPHLPESVPSKIVQEAIEHDIVRYFGSPEEVAHLLRRIKKATWQTSASEGGQLAAIHTLVENFIVEALARPWPKAGELTILDPKHTSKLAAEVVAAATAKPSSELAVSTYLLRCLDLHAGADPKHHKALAECAQKVAESAIVLAASRKKPIEHHRALLQRARALTELNNLGDAAKGIVAAKQLREASQADFKSAPPNRDEHAAFLETSTEMRLAEATAKGDLLRGGHDTLDENTKKRIEAEWKKDWISRLNQMPDHTGQTREELDWHDDAIAICITRWYIKYIEDIALQIRNIHEARQVIAFARLAHGCLADVSMKVAKARRTQKTPQRLFISHCSARKANVEKIQSSVSSGRSGIDAWIDKDAVAGTRWSKEILLRLLTADAVLVVESPAFPGEDAKTAYEASDWCKGERAISVKRSRRFSEPTIMRVDFGKFFDVATPTISIRTSVDAWLETAFDPAPIADEVRRSLAPNTRLSANAD